MRLSTHEWGSGERIALLVHGMMSDHRLWHRVGPELADRGYRVIAADLRGHGGSGRADVYTPSLFADDLAETLPAGAELAIGHSLGGLALSLAVDRLRPARAIYSDPAWCVTDQARQMGPAMFRTYARMSRRQIQFFNSRWPEDDLDIELATLQMWDPAVADFLAGGALATFLPERPLVPSLVQLPEVSYLTGPAEAALLTGRGFEIRRVEGTGHCIHRDDHDGFMASLEGWI
ncbi:alpha/beta hydrolase [Streptomyces sp. SL13]|jgi:pimeloyl-ACP methyl ester carboxylesterase|uniref:Alpha/beta hydrolase n=1 Tax=Streptantibioticus silvisoli TaxID=2705255 RepID=A0AA90HBU2_9ACTN|nr:alpha/beta hydrolase [Streptantibioticus silvisoli]MDI5972785.1 alpha/beta hydrolase [Streptantibioticus silvisoli]